MNFLIVIAAIGAVGSLIYLAIKQQDEGSPVLAHSGGDAPTGDNGGGGAEVSSSPVISSSLDFDGKVDRLARAIAHAEGGDRLGTIPWKYGNPGDLSVGDDYFGTSTGSTTVPDGEKLLIFTPGASWDSGDGFDALIEKVNRMLSGRSHVYTLDMTFQQVAQKYAANWVPWVANVTRAIGMSPTDTLGDYVNA